MADRGGRAKVVAIVGPMLVGVAVFIAGQADAQRSRRASPQPKHVQAQTKEQDGTGQNAQRMVEEGRQTFRFDIFGSEAFWGDTLKLQQALAGAKLGGVGAGVSPKTALSVGLKVDADALPANVVEALRKGQVDLDDPAATATVLKLNAVVGVKGVFDNGGKLSSVGITCALCTRASTTPLHPGSVIGLTAGPTAT